MRGGGLLWHFWREKTNFLEKIKKMFENVKRENVFARLLTRNEASIRSAVKNWSRINLLSESTSVRTFYESGPTVPPYPFSHPSVSEVAIGDRSSAFVGLGIHQLRFFQSEYLPTPPFAGNSPSRDPGSS